MSYFSTLDISASGMEVQKIRLDTVALNLANVNTTRGVDGRPYQPLKVVIGEKVPSQFDSTLSIYQQSLRGPEVVDISPTGASPKLVYKPEHPDANEDGLVAFPDINPVSEMVDLLEATRAYEANVRAVNAAKTMALRALEIGEG
ncbi:flagellar basal body rod protein FlgC [Marinobacterium sp. D7]|uniref:flagellar basal body rod protein FlgC n=1 Tax=Marinobacterium ramblicola TaxID=2849041 RepID=UPI001C2DCDBB|nr:flagellar basal body rod protein FlgC [Marinobacterium ramblicola]MBV1787727.1 flagellar basal body rod protein FlgC [Marinobacterium ramblicola]